MYFLRRSVTEGADPFDFNFSVLTLGLPGKVGYVCAVNSVTSRHLFAPAMI